MELIIFLSLVALAFITGTIAEKRHYRSIEEREQGFLKLPAVTVKQVCDAEKVLDSQMVTGSAVISVDYFKRFLAGLRNIIGGRVKTYETLLDRARREAVLRMKEQSPDADIVVNLRIETSSISKGRRQKSVGTVEALAYGTALHLKK